jgi:hypothetical protein
MIWFRKPKLLTSSSSPSQVENPRLKEAIVAHEAQRNPQSHLRLLQELNTARYLAAAQDDAVKFSVNQHTGLRTVDSDSRFKILMAAAPNGQPLLALFTDYAELHAWAQDKATASWSFAAQEAWAFALAVSAGVIVNPTSAAWVMGAEHIQWLQQHPL